MILRYFVNQAPGLLYKLRLSLQNFVQISRFVGTSRTRFWSIFSSHPLFM